jgi:hypothetical protein
MAISLARIELLEYNDRRQPLAARMSGDTWRFVNATLTITAAQNIALASCLA